MVDLFEDYFWLYKIVGGLFYYSFVVYCNNFDDIRVGFCYFYCMCDFGSVGFCIFGIVVWISGKSIFVVDLGV